MKGPTAKGRRVECPDFDGRMAWYDADTVKFRPAAYGILVHKGRVLLTQSRFTGLWDFPGGGVEAFEWMADGMAREFQEETGVEVLSDQLAYVAESYIAMFGRPYHSLRFYYLCHTAAEGEPELDYDPGEVSEITWFPLNSVPRDKMHESDREALDRVLESISDR